MLLRAQEINDPGPGKGWFSWTGDKWRGHKPDQHLSRGTSGRKRPEASIKTLPAAAVPAPTVPSKTPGLPSNMGFRPDREMDRQRWEKEEKV